MAEGAGDDPSILVIDDYVEIARMLVVQLASLGYPAIAASHGSVGLRLLAQYPGIRLLFTDVDMPGMGGLAVVRAALATRPGLRVIFMTGGSNTQGLAEIPGAILVRKPWRLGDIADAVRVMLADDGRPPAVVSPVALHGRMEAARPSPAAADRRRYVRIGLGGPGWLKAGTASRRPVSIIDVSRGGAQLLSSEGPTCPRGSWIEFIGPKPLDVWWDARVVMARDPRLHVAFHPEIIALGVVGALMQGSRPERG